MSSTNTPLFASIDAVEILLWCFTLFFIGLVFYLMRETRREGYPLEEDTTGRLEKIEGLFWWPSPKTFVLPNGQGSVSKPDPADRDTRAVAARRLAVWPGAPLIPTGDPMVDGVGPGSYAERAKVPDLDNHGNVRIAPLRLLPEFAVVKEDGDIRGFSIVGADGRTAGVVKELWVDRMESLIRYLEVETPDGGQSTRTVLVPFAMCTVNRSKRRIATDSAASGQFKNAPAIESMDQITRYEEDRVIGFFGGGYLYSDISRAEPLV